MDINENIMLRDEILNVIPDMFSQITDTYIGWLLIQTDFHINRKSIYIQSEGSG